MGGERFYRLWSEDGDLESFNVVEKESDLYIRAQKNLSSKAHKSVLKHRASLERYIKRSPDFLNSLEALPMEEDAPRIVKEMLRAGRNAGIGPMSAVAGAIAEFVGRDLLEYSPEVIVENGGDIFIKTLKTRRIGIYAGSSSFSGKIAIEIEPEKTPVGICTSSGTIGHSLSFGRADAAVVISASTALADAAATAIANMVKKESDIDRGIEFAKKIKGVKGFLVIKNDKMGAWGDITIKGD